MNTPTECPAAWLVEWRWKKDRWVQSGVYSHKETAEEQCVSSDPDIETRIVPLVRQSQ